ncbi:MAG: histidine--tRNA ligase [Gammaproteobacteria bacterium]|nr:histidine--tRNA ligase [Gammaproteobacteria bacterium]
MSKIQSVRGMNDVVPATAPKWQFVEDTARALLESYGYGEIRPPVVEKTQLFARSIGDVTDIVEKEMYTFDDRNGESLTLRPECTASVVRAALQHTLLRNQTPRFWYTGPMFRYEKPQKGRYRQFHQIGAEAFGMPGPHIDAEIILLLARLWRALGLKNIELELNCLGTSAARAQYRARLVDYMQAHREQLDEDSLRRLASNPLRILDSKNPQLQPLIENTPRLLDHIDGECAEHFAGLTAILDQAGLAYRVNHRLVRGLDYYSRTVFEWTTDQLGAQGTVCGGGRYDGLVSQLGGPDTPGIGFSMGVERIIELREAQNQAVEEPRPDAYLVGIGDAADWALYPLAERIRDTVPGISLVVDAQGGSVKTKFKRADRSGASVALIAGERELADGTVAIKPLGEGKQQSINIEALKTTLERIKSQGSGHLDNTS